MNNQWGRGSVGSTAGGSGIGTILFASVVCLALGGAAGYGAFRMTSDPASASVIAERDQRVVDLAGELDAASRQAEALTAENNALRQQIELRGGQTAGSEATVLKENARLSQQVVPALRKALEQAGRTVAEAEQAKRQAETDLLDRERQIALQSEQIARLERQLDQTRSERNASQSADIERLEAEAGTLRNELSEAKAAAQKMRTRELPDLLAEISRKNQEIATLTARNSALTAQINALTLAAPGTGDTKTDDAGTRDNRRPDGSRSPRNAALVARAIERTPGLDRLTGAQRTRLEQSLVSGECVTNALGGVLNRVPIVALRGLMRDLESDC